jgi:DNA polymerase-3 subunit alpha
MEARHMGLVVRPPQVNYARREFSVSYLDGKPVLFMGLDQVRDLTRRTQARILEERPFHSWNDFVARADPRPVEAENLVRAGALEGFGTIPALLRQLKGGSGRGGQLTLFELDLLDSEDWSLPEKVAAEEAILGIGVSAHPLELAAAQVVASGAITTLEAAGRVGQRVRLAGTRFTWRRIQTGRGEALYLTALEDLEGTLDVQISSAVRRRYQKELTDRGLLVIEGIVDVDNETGEPTIRLEKAWKLE